MTDPQLTVDLRSGFGPVRDQGARPTCLAFAASDLHAGLRTPWEPLSCEFAFFHAQRRANRTPTQGATLVATLETLREDGQPVETAWPYLARLPKDPAAWKPPAEVGLLHKRDGEPHSAVLEAIIGHLNKGRPSLVMLMLSDVFYNVGADGVLRAPASEAPDPARRHAVVVVGHGTIGNVRALLVRNSWGSDWGASGHGWLDERYLKPRLTRVATLRALT